MKFHYAERDYGWTLSVMAKLGARRAGVIVRKRRGSSRITLRTLVQARAAVRNALKSTRGNREKQL